MSLILEALRKLDRDKQTPERGLVVTGASTWARAEERRGLRLVVIVGAGVALGVGVWLWRGRVAHAPAAGNGGAPVATATPGATPPAAVGGWPSTGTGATESGLPAGAPGAADVTGAARGPETDGPRAASAPADSPRSQPPPRDGATALANGRAASSPRPSRAEAPATPGVAVADTPADDGSRPVAPGEAGSTRGPDDSGAPREVAAPAGDAPPATSADQVVLQAVTERDGHPIAIVNGRLVREGDSFDGIRILRIRPSEIEVEIGGQRRTVGF